ncbi:probable ATP-dependent RNA helicase DDX49, partial [Diaphorina citri]|uniref:RNA helicase n=1 Tax=Diaphorina citri TaxID=121845 RepID=A0A3Q0JIL3_DIACI
MEDPIKSFTDLKLNPWLIRQCQTIGVKTPTEIQKAIIPHVLNDEDCIGCAKTGSGKTLAFALPILQKWCEDPYGIFALVLTPTRELAYQIGDQFLVLGKVMNLRVSIITGGMDMVDQGKELAKKPHIVIATPGRLADHLDTCNTFSLNRIKFLVLDEADRLLSGIFDEQMRTIFGAVPKQKQTLLFSATMTDTLEQVKSITKKQVFVWESKQDVATVEELDQYYVLCPYDVKDGYLVETVRLYREKSPRGAIVIFTDTCRSCQVLTMMLNDIGLETVGLHGMISQRQRLAALSQFKSNVVKILVATDVASRGLDIAGVELVVNYNIPPAPKDYIHRVGRTARAGRYGNAISLVTPYDISLLKDIETAVGAKLEEFSVNGKKVSEIYMQVSVTRREAEIRLDETEFNSKKMINKRKKLILAGKTEEEADEIIARIEEKNALRLEKRKYAATIEAKGKKRKNDGDEGRLSGGKKMKKVGDSESHLEGKKMKKVGDEKSNLSKVGKMKKVGKNEARLSEGKMKKIDGGDIGGKKKKIDEGGGGKKKVSVIIEPIKLGKKKKLKTKMGGTPKVAGKNVKKSSESGSVSK